MLRIRYIAVMCLNAYRKSNRQVWQNAMTGLGKRFQDGDLTVPLALPLNGSHTGNLSLSPTSYYIRFTIRALGREFFVCRSQIGIAWPRNARMNRSGYRCALSLVPGVLQGLVAAAPLPARYG